MNDVTKKLLALYGGCALGGYYSEINPITLHHILPKHCGGCNKENNLIPICRFQHDMVHIIEQRNPEMFKKLSKYFNYVVRTLDMSMAEQWGHFVFEEIKSYGYYECRSKTNIKMLRKRKK